MQKLQKYLVALENYVPSLDVYNPTVSKSNVGWHIEHSLLTIERIIEAVQKSNPDNYTWSFKLSRILVFTMNKMPRGRAKAPKVVVPNPYNKETLLEHFKIVRGKMQELTNTSSDKYFNHPFFGNLKLDKTIKFLEIHTNHHIDIIKDISKK